MQEIQTKQGTESEEKKNTFEQEEDSSHNVSRESLWGAVLLACMLIFVVVSIGGVGWVAYTKWRSEKIAKSQPSITVLSGQTDETKAVLSTNETQAPTIVSEQEIRVSDSIATAKKLEISVLNGGGAKGSASTLASFLKTEGYSKVLTGNTINNYTGVVIYYSTGLEKEAGIIRESIVKKYPQPTIFPVDTKNKETSVSQITIILGK